MSGVLQQPRPCCPHHSHSSISTRCYVQAIKWRRQQHFGTVSLHLWQHSRQLLHERSCGRQQVACSVATADPPQAPAGPQQQELQVPRGDTAGASLVLEGVTVQAGDRDLLQEVSWRLMAGQRVGLVGANGCGKSTLLRCLCGIQKVDAGTLVVGAQVEVGYLEQTAVSGSRRTVWEEARSHMTALVAAEAAMAAAETAALQAHPQAAAMLQAAQDQFEAAGGYDADKRIANVLMGLGFKRAEWDKRCDEFSGGWQMRIALARLLLGPAGQSAVAGVSTGLLLLDEPTNHLDSAACKWLGSFLRGSSGGAVIVSHDEALLEDACDRIVEVRGAKLHSYVGSYASFLEQRKLREEQATSTAASQAAEIARLEAFVARFGAKASKASQAQSRAKALDKLRENAVDMPAPAAGSGPGDARKVSLILPKAPACHQEVLKVQGASIGWGSPEDGRPPLLAGVDLVVKKGQRILVLGPNGAGKSTLLKGIAGTVGLWGGKRELGQGAKLGVFSQDLAQDLPLQQPALDYVLEKAREDDVTVTLERGRRALGALGLTGSMALRPIGQLSGGEKARVALAAFSLVPYNVLLLDEASNHLDAQTIEVLANALQAFDGAIVAITHNAAFAGRLEATHILRVQDGKASLGHNLGLTAADFDHSPPKQPAKAEAPKAVVKAAPGKKGKAGTKKGKSQKLVAEPEPEPEPVAAAAVAQDDSGRPKGKNERLAMKKQAQAQEKASKHERKMKGKKR